jgi:hypothetical protein
MTYVNTIAATHDLADAGQAARMFRWMTDEPTSSGRADTFSRVEVGSDDGVSVIAVTSGEEI